MTFLTKSDKMGTCPFGVENVALASSAPALASALASSASVGPEVVQVVQRMWSISLRFPLQTDMCPFGPKSDAKTVTFLTTFRHGPT